MKKLLALLALTLLVAAPAGAQLVTGGDVGGTVIFRDKESFRAPNALLSMEWQVGLDGTEEVPGKHWLGLLGYYGITDDGGPGDLMGLGVRWYMKAAGGNIYPGLGVSGFFLGPAETDDGVTIIEKDTLLVGPELLLEIPWGEDDDKITAWAGIYRGFVGDDVDAMRFGLRAAFN